MAVGGAGIRLQGRSPRPAVASIASFPRLGRRVEQFGAPRGRRALRVPSLASSTGSAPPSCPRRATSRPLTSQSLLSGPQIPTGKWPPLPLGDSRLWQEATTRSDLFLPAPGCLVTEIGPSARLPSCGFGKHHHSLSLASTLVISP